MSTTPYEHHGAGGSPAVRSALGLCLLAVGGWLLTTARPWQKPGHPLTLTLTWTASGTLLLCGLLLLAHSARTVHGHDADADADGAGEAPARPVRPSGPPSTGR